MEFHFPLLQRRWSMGSRVYSFDRTPEISDTKQSQVVEIRSIDQWKAYFDSSKGNSKLLVIQFTATWCGPCRFMDPAVKEFAAMYKDVDFIKMDVDKFMLVADRFGANSLPAFVLIKRGKEVDRIVGVNKVGLQNKIEQRRI